MHLGWVWKELPWIVGIVSDGAIIKEPVKLLITPIRRLIKNKRESNQDNHLSIELKGVKNYQWISSTTLLNFSSKWFHWLNIYCMVVLYGCILYRVLSNQIWVLINQVKVVQRRTTPAEARRTREWLRPSDSKKKTNFLISSIYCFVIHIHWWGQYTFVLQFRWKSGIIN